ncbi:hypothetical protein MAIT1_05256 [Magnetofaba australis IT-1]|uniref:Cytochrome B561 n=1 Tax=Magnetofaba australis IT-1 TaxID=1434232 RepID=A0A1Y2K3V9_9PROT|nr:hypothetical protein MAIT1_05256 [Magnetofaba australis IT-1]
MGYPISNALTEFHEEWGGLLYALIPIHIAAALYYWRIKGENLILPLITGWMRLPAGFAAPRLVSLWLAALIFALCAGGVYWLVM